MLIAIVSAAGYQIPVLRSPVFVIEGAATVPSAANITPVDFTSVNSTLSPVPTPILVLRVAPDSATGSVLPSPTII